MQKPAYCWFKRPKQWYSAGKQEKTIRFFVKLKYFSENDKHKFNWQDCFELSACNMLY